MARLFRAAMHEGTHLLICYVGQKALERDEQAPLYCRQRCLPSPVCLMPACCCHPAGFTHAPAAPERMAKASLLLSASLLLCACAPPLAHALSNPVCADGGSTWVTERPTTDPRFPGASLWCEWPSCCSRHPCMHAKHHGSPVFLACMCCPMHHMLQQADAARSAAATVPMLRTFPSHAKHHIPPADIPCNAVFCDRGLSILGDSIEPCLNNGATCTPAVNDAICKLLGASPAPPHSFSLAHSCGCCSRLSCRASICPCMCCISARRITLAIHARLLGHTCPTCSQPARASVPTCMPPCKQAT